MKRNKFSLSHYKLGTYNMGYLYPIAWYEALPGDTVQQQSSMLIRCAPLLAPVMHPVHVRIHHWFVPNRLIWEDWEDFITGGPDGNDASVTPKYAASTVTEGNLVNHMGVPAGTYGTPQYISILPFRAYNLIYNNFYRDQDLCTERTISLASGLDVTTSMDLEKVAWEKDYFTTARPWTQKGTEVNIPLQSTAPVISDGVGFPSFDISPGGLTDVALRKDSGGVNTNWDAGTTEAGKAKWNDPALVADLSSATGISINDLREALAIQRYMEARSKYGSRYSEYLAYLGVRPKDSRMQEPEYLGGGRQTIQFSEVLRTGNDAVSTDPIGEMKGHGISAMRSNRFRRFFPEHGIVMSLMSVVPKAIYADALPRKFNRTTKEMYFQKELQTIGEQSIPNAEIQCDHTSRAETFGYVPRYDEYRSHPSTICGEFESSLNYWHLARQFGSDQSLNSDFVECSPSDRIFAATGSDQLYIMANHSIQARRMLIKKAYSKVI